MLRPLDFIARIPCTTIGLAAWVFWTALLVSFHAAAFSPPNVSSFAGIYVFAHTLPGGDAEARIAPETYVSPAIDGVTIVLPWGTMEPRPGVYDWTQFDLIAIPAINAGKKLSIGVLAGSSTPAWLYEAPFSVRNLTFEFGNARRACATLTVPVFWERPFVARYAIAAKALADHVKTVPGGWNAVRIAKLAAVATKSGELRVYSETGTAREGSACTPSNTAPMWASAGFDPGTALAAWQATTAAVAQAFPGKELSQDVLAGPGTAPAASGVPLLTRIIGAAAQTYRTGIIIQNDNLNLPPVAPAQAVLDARSAGTLIGWQTTAKARGGAACGSGPCDAAGYAALLAQGKALGGVTMEVHPKDVVTFGSVIAAAAR